MNELTALLFLSGGVPALAIWAVAFPHSGRAPAKIRFGLFLLFLAGCAASILGIVGLLGVSA